MPILDAALAFALTMLAIATAVTQIVRVIQAARKTRSKVMHQMLDEFFAKGVEPALTRRLANVPTSISSGLKAEVKQLKGDARQAKSAWKDTLFEDNQVDKLIDLPTEELMRRLRASKLGQELIKELAEDADALFDELGHRYEAIGDKFTLSFRAHSRWWATGIALGLALLFNINTVDVVDSYLNNTVAREVVLAQRDAFVADYQGLVKALEEDKTKTTITKDELKQAFASSQKQIKVAAAFGLPMGWSRFPYCCLDNNSSHPQCRTQGAFKSLVVWVFGILLTSVLAGLGGPFWYDVVNAVSRAAATAGREKKPKS